MQRDSIGFWGDPLGVGNCYAFGGSNPISNTDLDGRQAVEAVEAVLTAGSPAAPVAAPLLTVVFVKHKAGEWLGFTDQQQAESILVPAFMMHSVPHMANRLGLPTAGLSENDARVHRESGVYDKLGMGLRELGRLGKSGIALLGTLFAAKKNLDPDAPAEEVLPGSLERDFPTPLLGKSLREIMEALDKKPRGRDLTDLRKAKKVLRQWQRLLEKSKG